MNNGNEHFELRLFCILCEAWNNEYSSYIVTWLQWHLFIILGRLLSFFRRSSKGSSSQLPLSTTTSALWSAPTRRPQRRTMDSTHSELLPSEAELNALQQPISQNTEDSAHGSLLYTAVSPGRMHTAATAGITSVVEDAHCRPLPPDAGGPIPVAQSHYTYWVFMMSWVQQ